LVFYLEAAVALMGFAAGSMIMDEIHLEEDRYD
jgi:hypothetical protein